MSKIKIITDSGCDITPERAAELGIRLVPISFTFDSEVYYREGLDMPVSEFYEKLKVSSQIPKTSQITPVQFEEVFNEELDNGFDTLIVVTISSKGSGICQNARMIAAEVMENRGGEIIVVDSMGYSCIYGGAVVHAANMIKDGKNKDEIVSYLNQACSSMKAYFLVEDLLHLKKGGRINAATLVIANMLDIKPVLTIKDGLVVQKDKLRGSKKLFKKLVENAEDDGYDLSGKSVFIAYTGSRDAADEMAEALNENFDGVECIKYQVGAVVGCHGGPGLVGFIFSDKFDFTDYEG